MYCMNSPILNSCRVNTRKAKMGEVPDLDIGGDEKLAEIDSYNEED